MASFAVDPAFQGVGKEVGLTIWRIESLKPVRTEPETYGKFFSGDSYIVLNTFKKKGTSSSLLWDIHFWLGSDTSQDESGVAAYKTCELDSALGGFATQYRETQEFESTKFLALFRNIGGVMYLNGGIDSGFRHVEGKQYPTRLLQLKGKRNVRVKEVKVSRESLNLGDVFILDLGLMLYQWNGSGANRMEKAKGLQVCTRLRNDRGGNPAMQVLDGPDADCDSFWEQLGGKGPIMSAEEGGSDAAEEKKATQGVRLFGVKSDGEISMIPKGEKGRLTRDMCQSNGSYLLDTGSNIYLWVGKECPKDVRKESMATASKYLETNDRPAWTQVSSIIEFGETPEFKQYFYHWDPPYVPKMSSESTGIAKTHEQKEIDVHKLLLSKHMNEAPVDDGSGKVEMWRIENFVKVPVSDDKIGQFFAGDSYIVLYTYTPNKREEYLLYFWQGRHSTRDEKGASALLAKEMDDALQGRATQVRVEQGKEPGHFCSLFKGRMIVHAGGIDSGFAKADGTEKDGDSYDTDGVMFYQCKGTSPSNTRAVQVEEKASSLYSGDAFILLTPDVVFEWAGVGCNDVEKSSASEISEILKADRKVVAISEGEETEEFWSFLGGKGEYVTELVGDAENRPARLFQCTNATGTFSVEEVFDFSQDDLVDDDVMLLDTFNHVFVWVGSQANESEKRLSNDVARKYIDCAEDGRDKGSAVTTIQAGSEPPMFTCHFLGWDHEMANVFVDPYLAKLESMKSFQTTAPWAKKRTDVEEEAPAPKAAEATATVPVATGTFSYEDLKNGLPPGVIPSAKEDFLNAAEFQTVFSMTKEEFKALPKWKQQAQKKKVGLF